MGRCSMCNSASHSAEEHKEKLRRGRLKSTKWKTSVVEANKRTKTGVPRSEEAKQKTSETLLKTYDGNQELRDHLSEVRKETWAGRSQEKRDVIAAKSSATQKGRPFTPTHLANLRAANSKPRTEEYKRKLGVAHQMYPEVEVIMIRESSDLAFASALAFAEAA